MSTSSSDNKGINDAYFNACNFYSLLRGIHFVVLWMALANIFTNVARSGTSRRIMTLLVIVMFILSSVDYGSFWAYVRRAFIERGDTSQTTADSLEEYPAWFMGLTTASDTNAVIADGIIIWRCWVIWGRAWQVIVLPVICTMMTIAFSVIALYSSMKSTSFEGSGVDYATALYSTSLATTVYCTGTIVYRVCRLGQFKGPGPKPGPQVRTYRGVVEILVESSALYCAATLYALIAYIHGGPPSEYAWVFWTSVTGIAPTLIVARANSMNARPDQSWLDTTTRVSGTTSFPRFDVQAGRHDLHELHSVGGPATSGITAWSDDIEAASQNGKKEVLGGVIVA